jgi:serine/threonine protein kinase
VWLAPEVMANKIYTEKADVYSIGVILWELLTRKAFFGEIRFMSRLEDKVLSGARPPIPDDCLPAYRRLIEDCWAQQPGA